MQDTSDRLRLLESEIERVELDEAARHQPGAGEERQGQRELADNEA